MSEIVITTPRALRLRPPRIAMAMVAMAVAAQELHPVGLHAALPYAGTALGAAGFLLMLRAWWLFRRVGTAICPTAISSTLITGDVYALTRNPMYLGIAMMIAAPGLGSGAASFYVAAVVFLVLIDRLFCPYEERKAMREFGDEFIAYAMTVRRWL